MNGNKITTIVSTQTQKPRMTNEEKLTCIKAGNTFTTPVAAPFKFRYNNGTIERWSVDRWYYHCLIREIDTTKITVIGSVMCQSIDLEIPMEEIELFGEE